MQLTSQLVDIEESRVILLISSAFVYNIARAHLVCEPGFHGHPEQCSSLFPQRVGDKLYCSAEPYGQNHGSLQMTFNCSIMGLTVKLNPRSTSLSTRIESFDITYHPSMIPAVPSNHWLHLRSIFFFLCASRRRCFGDVQIPRGQIWRIRLDETLARRPFFRETRASNGGGRSGAGSRLGCGG